MEPITVKGVRIGEEEPVFIVAEAACNHMCQIDLAEKMIDLASQAGANAIKFQTYKAERLVTKEASMYWAGKPISQLEYYKKLDRFGEKEYAHLFEYADQKGIIAFATPFDLESASMLHKLGMPVFKIASCDLPDVRLLRHVAKFNKPIILSTGGSTPEEIRNAVNVLTKEGVRDLILMVCTLSYPTENNSAHLRRLTTFRKEFPGFIVGVSDHTEPDPQMVIPSAAVALGAKVIEKHYTLDRNMTGSGHAFSVSPDDLKRMVANIRLTEQVLGSSKLTVYEAEKAAREKARRSLVAEVPIKSGEIITSEMLGIKRPGTGLPAHMIDAVVGRRAKQDIEPDQQITLAMLEDS